MVGRDRVPTFSPTHFFTKETPHMSIEYTIDDDALTIGDIIKLKESGDDTDVMLDILRKCVTVKGGKFEDIPAKHFKQIVLAVLGPVNPSLGNSKRR